MGADFTRVRSTSLTVAMRSCVRDCEARQRNRHICHKIITVSQPFLVVCTSRIDSCITPDSVHRCVAPVLKQFIRLMYVEEIRKSMIFLDTLHFLRRSRKYSGRLEADNHGFAQFKTDLYGAEFFILIPIRTFVSAHPVAFYSWIRRTFGHNRTPIIVAGSPPIPSTRRTTPSRPIFH